MGGLYELDKMTSMKGRLNNHGLMGVTLQHEFRPKNLVTFSGEVDTKALDHSAKFGIAIALNSWFKDKKNWFEQFIFPIFDI
jgi:voltage-dependent anion channel protein 2